LENICFKILIVKSESECVSDSEKQKFVSTTLQGTTVRTHLPPYPPQKLAVEEVAPGDSADRRFLVSWTRPKGDFSKYSLMVTYLEKAKVRLDRPCD
jgi:hypothetical protein